jgi:hypothetical protein
MSEGLTRLDAEWAFVSALRELIKIASKGDASKSSYDKALELGGSLYPELLGPETSLLRRERESDTAKEYRQRAMLLSIKEHGPVSPSRLIHTDIDDMNTLLAIAKHSEGKKSRVDQLNKKLQRLISAERELNPTAHTENQLIFRDVYNVDRALPSLGVGQGYRDFQLPEDKILRIRVLHPDKPEHVSGADIIYERHSPKDERASIVAVQYKIWKRKRLRLSEPRTQSQLDRLTAFICENKLCQNVTSDRAYRFPFCAAFLRPTDKLQDADQKYLSTGEHLPICRIKDCERITDSGSKVLEYDRIKSIALSSEMFEYLFNRGKVGSRSLTYRELSALYKTFSIAASKDTVILYAQEFK